MVHDPKFQFGLDDVVYRRGEGTALPADEPLLLLRGKDQAAMVAMRAYIAVMRSVPDSELAEEHAQGMEAFHARVEKWQAEHPDRVGMGCHSCADPECREHIPAEVLDRFVFDPILF